jgi:hypothetical protein
MRVLLKALFALWLGLLAAVPLFPEDGGGGGGCGGVWILPGSSSITNRTGNSSTPPSLARAHRTYTDLTKDVTLELPPEMTDSLATMVVPMTGQPISLPVDGHTLRLSSTLLTGLVDNGVHQVDVLVVDTNNRGLRFTILFDLIARSATIYVF